MLSREEARRVETDFKYEGYLQQQERQMERMKRAESRQIPEWFEYGKVSGLSREVVEKLTKVRPLTLGQASRIPGITPAAVSLVNCFIEIFQRRAAEQASGVSENEYCFPGGIYLSPKIKGIDAPLTVKYR